MVGIIAKLCPRCGTPVPLGHVHECVYMGKAA